MPNRIQQIDIAHVQPSLIKGLIDNGTTRRHLAQEDDIVAGGIVIHTVGISERNGIAIVVVSPRPDFDQNGLAAVSLITAAL